MPDNRLLEAIRGRKHKRTPFSYGILTADLYVRTLEECVGLHNCYRFAAKGTTSFHDVMEKARRTTVYSNPEMVVEEKRVKLPAGIQTPKNTLMVFKHVLSTSTKDRDGDVLHSDGAELDPKMLLLWQHVHTLPIGKMLGVAEQTEDRISLYSAIVDLNELSHDAAVMVDNGMGRFSHGFRALDFTENKSEDGKESSFDIRKWEALEESLVSVPSNPEAETEEVLLSLVEGGKLTSPIMKEVGRGLRQERPVLLPVTWRERLGDRELEVSGSVDDVKTLVEGGKKDEDQSGGGGEKGEGPGEGGGAGASEEADAGAGTKEKGADSEVKGLYQLNGSWEDTALKLRGLAEEKLLKGGPEYEYVFIVATFSDRFVVCHRKGDEETYYRFGWELRDGKPVITSGPEEVEVQSTVVAKYYEALGDYTPPWAKPYPNEHSARLRDPGDFEADSFRRSNNKFGDGIHAIFGRLKGQDTATLQAVRFAKDKFTPAEAKKWLKDNDYKPIKFEPASEEGKSVEGDKAGRVLSKANEAKIREVVEDIKEAAGMEVPRGCKALLRQAAASLDKILESLGEGEAGGPKGLTVEDAVALVIAEASEKQARTLVDYFQAGMKRKQLIDGYNRLVGKR